MTLPDTRVIMVETKATISGPVEIRLRVELNCRTSLLTVVVRLSA